MALEKNTWGGETFESLKSAKDLPCMECSEGGECTGNALRVTVMHGGQPNGRPSAEAKLWRAIAFWETVTLLPCREAVCHLSSS